MLACSRVAPETALTLLASAAGVLAGLALARRTRASARLHEGLRRWGIALAWCGIAAVLWCLDRRAGSPTFIPGLGVTAAGNLCACMAAAGVSFALAGWFGRAAMRDAAAT